MADNRSESIVYLTLVDFLVQLIFFGVFIFVVFYASDSARRVEVPEGINARAAFPIIEGFGELVHEDNIVRFKELGKLLRNRDDLEALVSLLSKNGLDEVRKDILFIENKKGRDEIGRVLNSLGKIGGKIPCEGDYFPDLMTITSYDDFISIDSITPKGLEVFRREQVFVRAPSKLSWPEFLSKFAKLSQKKTSQGLECRYRVKRVVRSKSEQAFNNLWSRFWVEDIE